MEQLASTISPYVLPGLTQTEKSVDYIIARVCEKFGMTREQLTARTRKREIAEPRQVAMYILRGLGLSYAQVGSIFNKDHATAVYAKKHIENMLTYDRDFKAKVRGLLC
ncbi:MAG TPA: helix-turn-helix domain-containing protein [Bacteroidales bacterium]|jgi:chromosomal replication initiator protein|nr:hypothetical protein [Bacteroidales bacterium]HPI31110.1 helix-turn-helix domain-containing protein [Bacteroidales bacterium]